MASLDNDVKNQLKEVNSVIGNIEELFGKLKDVDYEDVTRNMAPLEKAQYDGTISYAYNSLYWMYLRSLGEDLKDYKIKEELDRIKSQMQRLQQIKDKSKRPKVDTAAFGRMVRHGTNNSGKKRKRKMEEEDWDKEDDTQKSS